MCKRCVTTIPFFYRKYPLYYRQSNESEDIHVKKFDISILSVSILLLGLVVLGVYESWGKKSDPVLAKAGDTEITQYELYNEMKGLYGKQIMNELVAQSLIIQEAKQQNITVSKEEIDKELAAMQQQIGSEEAFLDYLNSMGMDKVKLTEKMQVLMTRDKLLDQAFPITDEQIQAYYDQNKDQMGSPAPALEQVKDQIKMILTDSSRAENYDKWWTELQEKHHVKYADPTLKADKS